MFNVTIKFTNLDEAAFLAKFAEEAAFTGTLSERSQGILRETLKKCKGVTVTKKVPSQLYPGAEGEVTMTDEQLKRARLE